MGNTLQIVDDIKTSPTVILDLNNDSPWSAAAVLAPPPPLRRSVTSSMLWDGDLISSSAYGNRTITLTLDLISASQDNWAASFQTLARAVDQESFWLKYQPTGATSPVFFLCYRADVTGIDDIVGAIAYRRPTISIPAYPFALGLPEDVAAFTITNDPTTGTNKQMFTLPAIKGDVATPVMLAQTTGPGVSRAASGVGGSKVTYLSSYTLRTGTHALLARDLTQLTSGTDTGATVSGAGSNYIGGNYKSCSFATTAMVVRLSGSFSTTLNPVPGTYRVLIRGVAPSGVFSGTGVIDVQFGVLTDGSTTYAYLPQVTQDLTYVVGSDTGNLIDCGILSLPAGAPAGKVGLAPPPVQGRALSVAIKAQIGGAGAAFRFDELYLVPVETNYGTATTAIVQPPFWGASVQHNTVLYDGINDEVRTLYDSTGTAPFSGVPVPAAPVSAFQNFGFVGGLPAATPGMDNTITLVYEETVVTGTAVLAGRYYPRYLYVRPAST